MTWADYIIITVVSISVLIGMFRGFAREVVSLIVWIGGIALIIYNLPALETHLQIWIGSLYIRYAVIILVALTFILMLSWLLGKMLRLVVSSAGLGFVDRVFGLVFGFARGLVAIAFLVAVLLAVGVQSMPGLEASVLIPKVEPLAVWFGARVPSAFGERVSSDLGLSFEQERM